MYLNIYNFTAGLLLLGVPVSNISFFFIRQNPEG